MYTKNKKYLIQQSTSKITFKHKVPIKPLISKDILNNIKIRDMLYSKSRKKNQMIYP